MTRGLFLDLDGTLADSLPVLKAAYWDFLASYAIQGSEAEFQQLNGPPLETIIATLKKTHALVEEVSLLKRHYLDLIEKAHLVAPPAPGAKDLVLFAHQQGWRIAVVTSSPQAQAQAWLDRHGFGNMVAAVVGGDAIVGKPDPAPYIKGLELTRCRADQSWAVEDSRAGATSAVAAGLTTYVLADMADRADWPAGARFVENLRDIIKDMTLA
ncbi:MAG: HAD family phosphatase [Alphaproteobacteria bacterium]